MASPARPRDRSRSPRFYASLQDYLGTQGTDSAGSSRGLQRDNSGNYRGLSYDSYTSDSRSHTYGSPQGFSRFNNRLPYGRGRRARAPEPDYSVTQQMVGLSLNDPARSGGSASGYDSNITILPGYLPRPRARASPSSYSSDSNRTILSGEWPGPIRGREYRSRSAPRSYTPTVYAGGSRYTSSPEAVLGIPPRPMASPGSGRSGSPIYRSPPRSARWLSPPAAAQRRIHPLDLMGGEPRRAGTATGTWSRPLPPARARPIGSGDSRRTVGFADAYLGQARRDNSVPARSITSEESRAARRARVAQLARYEGLPALSHRQRDLILTPWRHDNTAQSRFCTEEGQERRNLDDAAGLLSDGESSVPFPYPRQEPYEAYRYSGGPFYGERDFSPRRPRSGFNWEYSPNDTQFSDATGHYSEDRGSTCRGDGRDQFHAFIHHPHFRSIAEDLRYGVGGRPWVNPNPPGPNPPVVVQDVMDQSF